MNQFFSFPRFAALLRKHLAEHLRVYLMSVVVLLGALALLLGLSAYPHGLRLHQQDAVYSTGLLASGTFFSSTLFAALGHRQAGTWALLLPASPWEKFLVGWVVSLPVFVLVFTGCFYAVAALVAALYGWHDPFQRLLPLFSHIFTARWALAWYVGLNAVFLWGSVFFPKQHFIRTAFALVLAGLVLAVVNYQVMQYLVPAQVESVLPFISLSIWQPQEGVTYIELPMAQQNWLWLLGGGLALLSWAGTYFSLKEKQL